MMRASLILTALLAVVSPVSGVAVEISVQPDGAILTNSPIHLKIEISDLGEATEAAAVAFIVDGNLLETLSLEA